MELSGHLARPFSSSNTHEFHEIHNAQGFHNSSSFDFKKIFFLSFLVRELKPFGLVEIVKVKKIKCVFEFEKYVFLKILMTFSVQNYNFIFIFKFKVKQ
jgi:hypothetical protein